MKYWKQNFPESNAELEYAGDAIDFEDSIQMPLDEQQRLYEVIAEEEHTHEDIDELLRALQAMSFMGAPPAIGAAALLIRRIQQAANNHSLKDSKRKNKVWSLAHPGRNTMLTDKRDQILRRVVDYLVGTDICENRPNGWTIENLADPESPLFEVVSESAIEKIRRRTQTPSIEIANDAELDSQLDGLRAVQHELAARAASEPS